MELEWKESFVRWCPAWRTSETLTGVEVIIQICEAEREAWLFRCPTIVKTAMRSCIYRLVARRLYVRSYAQRCRANVLLIGTEPPFP